MFTGAVCAEVREWFKANSDAFTDRRIRVGCCGNFTIETVLSQSERPPQEIISCDVSFYSSALGAYFTDKPFEVAVKLDWQWLTPYTTTPDDIAATAVVLLEMAPFYRQRNEYQARIWRHFFNNFGKYHQAAAQRLQARKKVLRLDEYQAKDVVEFMEESPKDTTFLSFMPTYAGGYEKLYQIFDEAFTWNEPSYQMMDMKGKEQLLEAMAERGDFVHVDDMRRDNMTVVGISEGGHKKAVYIHSNIPQLHSWYYKDMPKKRVAPHCQILELDTQLEPPYEIAVMVLKSEEFAWVRDQHLNKHILPAEPSWKFGVCVNGILVGLVGWARGKDGESFYLLCDMALPSNHYQRLSKLVCLVARSEHMGSILRQITGRLWFDFSTTAFTKKAVSMKYRGVFDLLGRNEKEGKLNYGGTFDIKLEKAVTKWQKLEKKAKN